MTALRAQAALLLLLLAGSIATSSTGCVTTVYTEGFFTDVITLTDLDPKVMPMALDVDDDPKDAIYKSKARYRPATASSFGSKKDQRLLLRGKKDAANVRAQLEVGFFATRYELHARVAFDPAKTKGLVHGQTTAFFDLRLDTSSEGAPPIRRIEAVYDATNNGFMVRATDDIGFLGPTLLFAETSELVLQFRFDGVDLFMEAGAATGSSVTDFTPMLIYSEATPFNGIARQAVGWGARGLGKKGSLYINQLTLGGVLPDIGTAETPIALKLMDVYNECLNAASAPDFFSASNVIEVTRLSLEDIRDDMQAAVTGATFQPATQGERSLLNIEKALKLVTQGDAIAEKQATGAQKSKPINKKAKQALRFLQVGFAQLAGFKSNSLKRVQNSGFLPFTF